MARNVSNSTPEVISKTSGPLGIFGQGRVQFFSAPGTYTFTTPAGVKAIKVRVWGAGGSGASIGNGATSIGGAGGGYSEKTIINPSGSYSVTVGAGGAKRINNNGLGGGSSSFGSECSATGGQGGNYASSNATGGSGSGGDVNYTGGTVVWQGQSQTATGGGSAAGPWGNGYGIPTSWINDNYQAIGGAGVGGYPSKRTTSNSWEATGGGGAFGSGSNMSSGPDVNGNIFPQLFSSTSPIVASSPTEINSPILLRFPGEYLGGIGGQAVRLNVAGSATAGNAGPGGGGGAAAPVNGASAGLIGGNGGIFGGGGGVVSGSSNSSGGNGGIAAGGGSISITNNPTTLTLSGGGGDGLVVVEW